jgi:hypothetical protein
MATQQRIGAVPRRHEVEELAATAVTGRSHGRMPFRHEREELARRLAVHRASARRTGASR